MKFRLVKFDLLACVHQCLVHFLSTPLRQTVAPRHHSRAVATERQGQYLAYIHACTKIHRMSPAETDMKRQFRVTPPSVYQMVLNLDRARLIERTPGQPLSIRLLVSPESLPTLK